VAAALWGSLSLAQTQPPARPKPKSRGHKAAAVKADAGAVEAPRATGDAGQGELVQQKTLDGGAKVFRFGELEIEGRLKNPQLVFFLRRVRAEFAAGDLGHRSFLRELDETKRDPNF
jgi:hypothetical protein